MPAKKKKLPEGIRELASGRYQARYPVTTNGVTRQVSCGTFASLADAKDARSLAMVQRRTGAWVDPSGPRTTVRLWSEQWLTLRRQPLPPSRQSFLRVHILPAFGDRRLGDLTPMDVQHWVNGLSGLGLASTTVNAVYGLFKQMLAAAVDYDVLPKSPCRMVKLPTNRASKPTKITVEQLWALEAAAPPRFAAMIHLSTWAGLRWQEAAALRWSNVDLARGALTVIEAIKVDKKVGSTKNERTRIVHIAPETVEVLTRHRRDFGANGLLFPNTYGRLLAYSAFRRDVWEPLVTRCGLDPRPTYHDLRHSYAAHLVDSGLDPRALQESMGHHSAAFTMSRYGWATDNAGAAVVAAVQAAMGDR